MTKSAQLCLGHFARVATDLGGFSLDVGVFQMSRHGSVDARIVAILHTRQRHQLFLAQILERSDHAHVLRLDRAAVRVGQQSVRGSFQSRGRCNASKSALMALSLWLRHSSTNSRVPFGLPPGLAELPGLNGLPTTLAMPMRFRCGSQHLGPVGLAFAGIIMRSWCSNGWHGRDAGSGCTSSRHTAHIWTRSNDCGV